MGHLRTYLKVYHADGKQDMPLFYTVNKGRTDRMSASNVGRIINKYASEIRPDVNIVLRHLDRAETCRYIESHLRYAGGRQDIFTDRALDEVFKDSAGISRMINRICEKTLMYASQQQKRLVDEHMVRFVSEHEMLKGGDM